MQMMMTNRKTRPGRVYRLAFVLSLITALFSGCGANENILKSGKETPSPVNAVSPRSSFEQDLESMHTAKFMFVYVIRRKDGKPIDAEDRSVIKVQTKDMNRRLSSDDDKAFIIGSNYQLPAANIAVLRDRFAFEDLSPGPPTASNANAAANK